MNKKIDNNSKPYMFDDNDFNDSALAAAKKEVAEPSFTESQLSAARQEGYNLGKSEGITETKTSQDQTTLDILNNIAQSAQQLLQAEQKREQEKDASIAALSLRICKKILPNFARKYALQEIEQVIIDALSERLEEPRIVIRIHNDLLEPLKEKIDALSHDRGFNGQIIIISDDHLSLTDCHIEWADGGAERNFERLFSTIERQFTSAIKALGTEDLEPKTSNNTLK